MAKYKVGDELIIIESEDEYYEKTKKNCFLNYQDNMSILSLAINVVKVEYNCPEVLVAYKTPLNDTIHKVIATCKDTDNFDEEKVLEKALLKAHLQELIKLSTMRNHNLNKF